MMASNEPNDTGGTTTATDFRERLPRVYELFCDQVPDRFLPNAYLHDFENSLDTCRSMFEAFIDLEKELDMLDSQSFGTLKAEIAPLLHSATQEERGIQQAFNRVNEIKGYIHLKKDMGCKDVSFIPRSDRRTPDLQGFLGPTKVLCEVKTINISQDEMEFRKGRSVRRGTPPLTEGFFRKLDDDMATAKKQLYNYDPSDETMHAAYIFVQLDDWVGDNDEINFPLILRHIAEKRPQGLTIILHIKTIRSEMHQVIS
jgi:hypothetical protein